MRFISISIFFAILTLLLHVTVAAPHLQKPFPTPSEAPSWWQRPYQRYKMNQHTKKAAERHQLAIRYRNKGQNAKNDPSLTHEKRAKRSKEYEQMAEGEAAKSDDHRQKARNYKAMLDAGKASSWACRARGVALVSPLRGRVGGLSLDTYSFGWIGNCNNYIWCRTSLSKKEVWSTLSPSSVLSLTPKTKLYLCSNHCIP